MNHSFFQKIIRNIKNEDSYDSSVFMLNENAPDSITYLKYAISKETDINFSIKLIELYNDILSNQYPNYLNYLLSKDYVSYQELLAHSTSFIFNYNSFETEVKLNHLIDKLISKLDKKIIENGTAKEIIQELNLKLTKSFLIDESFINHHNFLEGSQNQIISQFSLSIIVLAIAEKMKLPIFGIPLENKLVLCYAHNYCLHNELVFEDDIIYYIILGEKDIIYTPFDLMLYSILVEKPLEIENKLPGSSQKIIKKWLDNLLINNYDTKSKNILSIKYQQIFSTSTEYNNI